MALDLASVDAAAIARALHVLAVVVWIGGVSLVTTAVLPAARRAAALAGGGDALSAEAGLALFEAVERRFAPQARIATLLAGASGFYLTWALDLWDRFREPGFWWMHAMVGLWALFMVLLFIVDPFFLHGWLHRIARTRPRLAFRLLAGMHWLLLALGSVTILAAVAGVHGLAFTG